MMNEVEKQKVVENVRRQAERVAQRLHSELGGRKYIGEIRQRGLMIGLEMVLDRATKAGFGPLVKPAALVCRLARQNGLLIRPLGDTITFLPPLISTDDEIDSMLNILVAAYNQAEAILASGNS